VPVKYIRKYRKQRRIPVDSGRIREERRYLVTSFCIFNVLCEAHIEGF
jgi:hypothetical protein